MSLSLIARSRRINFSSVYSFPSPRALVEVPSELRERTKQGSSEPRRDEVVKNEHLVEGSRAAAIRDSMNPLEFNSLRVLNASRHVGSRVLHGTPKLVAQKRRTQTHRMSPAAERVRDWLAPIDARTRTLCGLAFLKVGRLNVRTHHPEHLPPHGGKLTRWGTRDPQAKIGD